MQVQTVQKNLKAQAQQRAELIQQRQEERAKKSRENAINSSKIGLGIVGLGILGIAGVKIYNKKAKIAQKEQILGKTSALIEKAETKMRSIFPTFSDKEIFETTKLHLLFMAEKADKTKTAQIPHSIVITGGSKEKAARFLDNLSEVTGCNIRAFKAHQDDNEIKYVANEAKSVFESDKKRTIIAFTDINDVFNPFDATNPKAEIFEKLKEKSLENGVHPLAKTHLEHVVDEKTRKNAFVIDLKDNPREEKNKTTGEKSLDILSYIPDFDYLLLDVLQVLVGH